MPLYSSSHDDGDAAAAARAVAAARRAKAGMAVVGGRWEDGTSRCLSRARPPAAWAAPRPAGDGTFTDALTSCRGPMMVLLSLERVLHLEVKH